MILQFSQPPAKTDAVKKEHTNVIDMAPPKAWFKLVKPESGWDKVPLVDVEDVTDLKKAKSWRDRLH